MSLWILLSAHFIADFSLQSADWALKKTQHFRYLAGHAITYAAVITASLLACVPFHYAWCSLTIISISHFVIDWVRVNADKKYNKPLQLFYSFLIDQVLHITVIGSMVYWFGLNIQVRSWVVMLSQYCPLEKILRYALIFIVILDPASVFVKKLSQYVAGNTNDSTDEKEQPVGRVIGKVERILTAILVLCGKIEAIGFVLTAKSLARYKQLDNQKFAEKYLVGTLSSTAIAIIVALLLK